jgi:uncharacterized protein YjbI with pentapeptide repeats
MGMTTLNDNENYFESQFSKVAHVSKNVTNSSFEECDFSECDFSKTYFNGCKFTNCRFIGCNLSLAQFQNTRLFGVEFVESKLMGIDFTKADWPVFHLDFELSFKRSILNDISMFGLTLHELKMDECKIHGADFREGSFSQSVMTDCDFSQSLFMRTNLESVDFTDSYNFNIDVLENRVNKAKFSRFEALNLLNSLGIELVG